jgi:transforming growth factor-beta-induced protein
MMPAALNGKTLTIGIGDSVTVNDATVTTADVAASNGVIHIIDSVLTPPADGPGNLAEVATEAGSFTTLLALLTKADLATTVATGGPFTVFAPTNDAFEAAGISADNFNTDAELAALTTVLLYHVLNGTTMSGDLTDGMTPATLATDETVIIGVGDTVTVDWATVVTPDVAASNGVIHVVDRVLLPGANIAEVATGAGSFTTLLALLVKTDLAFTVSTAGPMTVFAPTDAAFATAGISADDFNTEAEIAALTGILLYHVVDGAVLSTDLTEGMTPTTLNGATLNITLAGGAKVNGSTVSGPDTMAVNGVIHVIDGVLLPPAM